MFFASERNAQAVTTLMAGPKVELGDDMAASYGSELVVRSEDLEGAMNSMKQHAPIWNGVKADYLSSLPLPPLLSGWRHSPLSPLLSGGGSLLSPPFSRGGGLAARWPVASD